MPDNSAYIEMLRSSFITIRDERRTAANTAERIGTAFLELLDLVSGIDTPWETIEDPETGEKSAHLREEYDGAWTEGYLSALGRGENEDAALLFDPIASINEANLGMPQEDGVGIVWNGLRWVYGKTGGGGFSSISQDGLSLTFSGDGIQSQTINLSHTHNVSDLNNDLGFVTQSTLTGFLAEKVDVSWFRTLFKAYNSNGTEITPNTVGTIDNIKAMFGFWTEQYLSALGRGSSGSSMLDETMMWSLLGSSGNQQIDISHLQYALGTFMPLGVLVSVAKGSADGKIDFVGTGTGNVYTVDFIHSHAFADITGRPNTLAGYGITDAYTMTQTDALLATKVDVSWFRTLFKAYNGSGTEITPNAAGTIDNIQAMVGFWTNQYISALGRGSTGSTMLDETLMWSLLANSDTTKQISLSHLTTALASYAQTTNVITSVAKNSTDGKINFISQAQTYTVDFNHTHQWAQITGQPTNVSYFQNDAHYATTSEVTSALSQLSFFNTISRVSDGKLRWSGQNATADVDFIHSHAFADITGRPNTLAGYGITDAYTMTQTDALLATKVDVSWFRTLFKAYNGSGTEITPNAAGAIDNIQAMVGFWTNQYISALGRGSTGSTMLDETLMWSLLANSDTTKQISLSHLTTALASYAQTTNVITSVAKNSTDGKINFISQAQTYTVDFNHTHQWAQITGQPTNVSYFQNDAHYATTSEVTSALSQLSFYNNATWNSSNLALTLSGQNASKAVTLSHTHDVYLGTTKLTTGNAIASVINITGLGSINADALVLRQISYGGATVNAVGIGAAPSYPLDVSVYTRFRSTVQVYSSTSQVLIGSNGISFFDVSSNYMYFRNYFNYNSGSGAITRCLIISSYSSGENGLIVYSTNEVRFTAGAWSDSYLSALGQNTSSDQRLKTELGKVGLKVDDVAAAPMVRYLWSQRPWLGEQAGSYAQYWQAVLPEAVKVGHDGYLEMQYGVIALLSVIATARQVVDHERRIRVLEEENKQLKKQLKPNGYAIQ